jgi:uncharacterized zinc-type alcohol dehydrogenase-like protein
MFRAYAAKEAGKELIPFEYDPGQLEPDEIEVRIESCGICHSDLSMLNNDWAMTNYPFVPGHEVIGTVESVGERVSHIKIGQRVGIGWYSKSCMTCESCMTGDHHLCGSAQGIIVGRHGGFADRVRADAAWAIPLPSGLKPESAGPLLCGGITVFNPILQFDVKPTHRVGVIGIGGLGHLALKFLNAWGCEVTAFSSSPHKEEEARGLGADHFVNSADSHALGKISGSLDFIISTVNVTLDWSAYINVLSPKGRLHVVGAVMEPMSVPVFPLLIGQKSISGSPVGSPKSIATMLDFAARHKIEPVIEPFSLYQVNEAMEKLRQGKAKYRLVLLNEG